MSSLNIKCFFGDKEESKENSVILIQMHPECKYCYDKGFYTIADEGNIVKRPCRRCQKKEPVKCKACNYESEYKEKSPAPHTCSIVIPESCEKEGERCQYNGRNFKACPEHGIEEENITFFEKELLESYEDYIKNWKKYLVPADVQEFGHDGGGPYINHTFSSFIKYLKNKNMGIKSTYPHNTL